MKKKLVYSLCLCMLLFQSLQSVVEDSIIVEMDHYEQVENLDSDKIGKGQLSEIVSALKRKDQKVRVITYNMLFNVYDSKLPETHRWPDRVYRIAELIDEMDPDIISSQELYGDQVEDLLRLIGDRYTFFGVPSVNLQTGEQSEVDGIFYRKERFKVLEKQGFYISDDPEKITSDPYSSVARVLTMLKLEDRRSGKEFFVFNTHASFSNPNSREFSIKFIVEMVQPLMEEYPVFVTGDWNTFPGKIDDRTLPFYDGDFLLKILRSGGLMDSKGEAIIGKVGPLSTFTNEPGKSVGFLGTGTPGIFLDHIYINEKVKVLIHGVQPAKVNGLFPSDHMPVVIDALFDE